MENGRCWICDQKTDYKYEKLNAARREAKEKATNEQATQAIWKEGTLYKYGLPSDARGDIIEFVSKHHNSPSK